MSFREAILTCFKKYASCKGRASRSEYWWFMLFQFIGVVVLGLLSLAADFFMVLLAIFILVVLLPGTAVTMRRLQDIDKSVLFLFLYMLPGLGWAMLFIFCCTKGSDGENYFGPDPLQAKNS